MEILTSGYTLNFLGCIFIYKQWPRGSTLSDSGLFTSFRHVSMDQSIHTEYILIRYSIYFDIKLCLVAWISIIDFSIYFGDFRLSSVGCVARQANEAWTDLEKTLFLPDIFGQLGSGDVEGASHRGAALRPFVGSTASCASHHQGCTNDHCPMHWASVISCNFFQVVL